MEKNNEDIQRFIEAVEKEFGLHMVTERKIRQAVFGISTSNGLANGVGEDAEPSVILAKYDQLGGYITKDGYKVKNGLFFDKKTKKPVKPSKVTLLIRMNGEYVEHQEGAPETPEIQVAKKLARKGKKKEEEKDEDKAE